MVDQVQLNNEKVGIPKQSIKENTRRINSADPETKSETNDFVLRNID